MNTALTLHSCRMFTSCQPIILETIDKKSTFVFEMFQPNL